MSHEIQYFDYDANINKSKVENELNDYVSHATWQEGGGGLDSPIRWLNKTCESYDEAQKYISSVDNGWYDQIAVKYKDYGRVDESKLKKYNELSDKSRKAYEKVKALETTNHFKDVKAAYIGCPHCGSKINKDIYVNKRPNCKVNYCPVCLESMLKDTALKQLTTARDKYNKLIKQANEEYQKQQSKNKPKEKWLVKIEYHV